MQRYIGPWGKDGESESDEDSRGRSRLFFRAAYSSRLLLVVCITDPAAEPQKKKMEAPQTEADKMKARAARFGGNASPAVAATGAADDMDVYSYTTPSS